MGKPFDSGQLLLAHSMATVTSSEKYTGKVKLSGFLSCICSFSAARLSANPIFLPEFSLS